MKRVFFLCCMAIGLMAAVSCHKEFGPEGGTGTGTDDARYLMSQLVVVDESDNITGYMTGFAFNAADPGEISIHCETLEKARELFRSWAPDNQEFMAEGEALSWALTDTLGVSQGEAVLKPGGAKGAVAHLELPVGFPAVSGVLFLPSSAMPENGELDLAEELDDYYFLNVVSHSGAHGSGQFVVIREYDQDTNTSGILLRTGPEEYNLWALTVSFDTKAQMGKRARTKSELQSVANFYKKYAKYIDERLKSIGCPNGDHWYFAYNASSDAAYRLNFHDYEPQSLNPFQPTFHEAWVYFFSFEKKSDGYQLVFK